LFEKKLLMRHKFQNELLELSRIYHSLWPNFFCLEIDELE